MLYHFHHLNGDLLELDVPVRRSSEDALLEYDAERYPFGFTTVIPIENDDELVSCMVMTEPTHGVTLMGPATTDSNGIKVVQFSVQYPHEAVRLAISYDMSTKTWGVRPVLPYQFYHTVHIVNDLNDMLRHLYHIPPDRGVSVLYVFSEDTIRTLIRVAHKQLGVDL